MKQRRKKKQNNNWVTKTGTTAALRHTKARNKKTKQHITHTTKQPSLHSTTLMLTHPATSIHAIQIETENEKTKNKKQKLKKTSVKTKDKQTHDKH